MTRRGIAQKTQLTMISAFDAWQTEPFKTNVAAQVLTKPKKVQIAVNLIKNVLLKAYVLERFQCSRKASIEINEFTAPAMN
mmetsp:Transcript_161371/g.297707  ORF Transcript_161371/g.297707 Transcript_161371/m.297707 type:complete len:81 (+) Transcript_161371:561-803(+)